MPIEYQVSDDGLTVYATAKKVCTPEDTLNFEKAIAADTRIKPGYCGLFDGTQVTNFHFTKEDIEKITATFMSNPKNTPGRKVAIVARSNIIAALNSYYEKYSGKNRNENVIIFNDISTARIWLGVTADLSN